VGPDCWSGRASLASAWITSDNPTSSSAVSRLVHTEPAPRDWSNHSGSLASTNDRPMQHATTSVARDIAIANNTTKRANQSVGKESRSSIDTSSSTYLVYPSKKRKCRTNRPMLRSTRTNSKLRSALWTKSSVMCSRLNGVSSLFSSIIIVNNKYFSERP